MNLISPEGRVIHERSSALSDPRRPRFFIRFCAARDNYALFRFVLRISVRLIDHRVLVSAPQRGADFLRFWRRTYDIQTNHPGQPGDHAAVPEGKKLFRILQPAGTIPAAGGRAGGDADDLADDGVGQQLLHHFSSLLFS